MKATLLCPILAAIAIDCCCAADAQSRGTLLEHAWRWPAAAAGDRLCLDVAEDGSQAVVGTFAAPRDPNVFVFDRRGRFVRSLVVGQRGIAQVSQSGGGHLHALCTMPEGRAGDGPIAFACQDPPVPIPSGLGEAG